MPSLNKYFDQWIKDHNRELNKKIWAALDKCGLPKCNTCIHNLSTDSLCDSCERYKQNLKTTQWLFDDEEYFKIFGNKI